MGYDFLKLHTMKQKGILLCIQEVLAHFIQYLAVLNRSRLL